MKIRTFLSALPLAIVLAACGADSPTAAPERAAFDGAPAPVDTSTIARGGSFGPGH